MFHKDHLKKPTVTFSPLNSALPMAKPLVKSAKPSAKQKQGRPTGSTKWAKKWDIRRRGFFFPVLVCLEGFFTNSVSLRRDEYSASFFNSASFHLWAAHWHRSSGFLSQSPIGLGGFSSNWSSGFPLQFPTWLGGFSSTMLYQVLPLYAYTLSRPRALEERQL